MKKGWIVGSVVGVLFPIVIAVAIVAASVGSEASKMDAMLKNDLHNHKSLDEMQKQLTDEG
jgi:hypothetical protein